jgi:hypothetical protein
MSFDLVNVRVGEPNKTVDFPVYRELLSSVSPYFRSAFEESFKEVADRIIPLTDVSNSTFRAFVQWAHAQLLSSQNGQIPNHSILDDTPDHVVSKVETDMHDANETINAGSSPVHHDSCVSGCRVTKVFDEYGYQTLPISYEWLDHLYMKRVSWLEKYRPVPLSYLRLFIVADKYSVHQQRDDILTSMIGHVHT